MIKGIIFDLDGTLLDSIYDIEASLNEVLRSNGMGTHTTEEYRSFIGNGVDKLISRAIGGVDKGDVFDKIKREYSSYYSAHSDVYTKPFDGIPEALCELKSRGCRMAILSNKGDADVRYLADKYFPGIFSVAHGQFGSYKVKPCPDLALLTAKQLGIEPCELIFAGDSPEDTMTAHNAGIRAVAVLWGYRSEDILRKAGCDFVCSEPSHLMKITAEADR